MARIVLERDDQALVAEGGHEGDELLLIQRMGSRRGSVRGEGGGDLLRHRQVSSCREVPRVKPDAHGALVVDELIAVGGEHRGNRCDEHVVASALRAPHVRPLGRHRIAGGRRRSGSRGNFALESPQDRGVRCGDGVDRSFGPDGDGQPVELGQPEPLASTGLWPAQVHPVALEHDDDTAT